MAVVSDLESVAAAGGAEAGRLLGGPAASVAEDFESAHYLRFVVNDRPGIVAALCDVFARHELNVDSVLQDPGGRKEQLVFVMTLDPCDAGLVNAALRDAAALDFHARPPLWMPVLP